MPITAGRKGWSTGSGSTVTMEVSSFRPSTREARLAQSELKRSKRMVTRLSFTNSEASFDR